MPRDDFLKGDEFLPRGLTKDMELFRRDLNYSHDVTRTILSCLSDLLHPYTRFEDFHRSDEASQSSIIYFRYMKQTKQEQEKQSGVGHNMHTDLGTLTLLYTENWGLQVYNQENNSWNYVAPKQNLYVVNVGDALRFFSGNQLMSALHRVVPVPGLEAEYRFSTAYFLRPEDNATYRTSENTVMRVMDWHDSKYEIFKKDHEEQKKNTILTGGIGVF